MVLDTSQQLSEPSAHDNLAQAIINDSLQQLDAALEQFEQNRRGLTDATLDWALNVAVKFAKPDIVTYLIDDRGAKVEGVRVVSVGIASRDEEVIKEDWVERIERVLDALVAKGWNIEGSQNSDSLISQVIISESLLRWCLAHNARLDVDPPITEEIAAHGSLSSLKLLLEHNAPLGRRTLHTAVAVAADASGEERAERMQIVKYLIEEKGVDVNLMDAPEGMKPGNHWGTPMAYAVSAGMAAEKNVEEVVQWLLKKGANPHIRDCWDQSDVLGLAERFNVQGALKVLREWEEKNGKGGG